MENQFPEPELFCTSLGHSCSTQPQDLALLPFRCASSINMHDKQSKEVALREGLVTQVRARTDVGERQVRGHATVAERRGWERLPISIPFFVRGINPGNEEFLEFATALNVSAGGVLLAAKRYLDPGTKISLEVPVALINKAQLPHSIARLQATVLRCTADRQYFLLGVQFEEPLLRHDGNQNHDGA